MSKIPVIVLTIAIFLVFFLGPLREGIDNLVRKDNATQSDEEKVIGTVAIVNPRVKEIQQILKGAGFYEGSIDGQMGVNTRAAIIEFQKEHKLKPNGKVDSTTWLALSKSNEEKKSAPAANTPIPVKVVVKEPLPVLAPQPVVAAQTPNKSVPIKSISKKSATPYDVLSPRLKLKDGVKKIQLALKKSGFYAGEIDGKAGKQTQGAVIAFQRANGLKSDGLVGTKTWNELSRYLED